MRKLIEATLVSLDGVVADPQDWALPYWGEESKEHALAALYDFDAFLLGRVTYEGFVAAWSQVEGDPYIDAINRLPKYVASRHLLQTTWNATLLQGDTAAAIARLKNQPGKDIVKYGTSQLDATLIRHGLIDEFRFSLFPLVVGTGRRLFEGIDTSGLTLKLAGKTTYGNGIVELTYLPEYPLHRPRVDQDASDGDPA
jgi:dihydrofolate reductase